jgi:hypothetical protein
MHTYIEKLRKRMNEVHKDAIINQTRSKVRAAKYYNKKAVDFEYEENDLVWVLDQKRTVGLSPKLQPIYKGPFIITRKMNPLNYEIKPTDGTKTTVIHFNRLKPYYGRINDELIDNTEEDDKEKEDEANLANSKQEEITTATSVLSNKNNKLQTTAEIEDEEEKITAEIIEDNEEEDADCFPPKRQQNKTSNNAEENTVRNTTETTTIRPRRNRKQKVLFTSNINNMYTTGIRIPKYTYTLYLITACLITSLTICSQVKAQDNLAELAGNIRKCSIDKGAAIISIMKPRNCDEIINNEKENKKGHIFKIETIPFFKRHVSEKISVHTCTKETITIITTMSFFGAKSVLDRSIKQEPIQEAECRLYIQQINSNKSSFKEITDNLFVLGEEPEVRFSYCCVNVANTAVKIIIKKGTAVLHYDTQKLITSLFPTLKCSVETTSCLPTNEIAVWDITPINRCELIEDESVMSDMHDDFVVSKAGRFAVKLTGKIETICGISLHTSYEGLFLEILDSTEQQDLQRYLHDKHFEFKYPNHTNSILYSKQTIVV